MWLCVQSYRIVHVFFFVVVNIDFFPLCFVYCHSAFLFYSSISKLATSIYSLTTVLSKCPVNFNLNT